jgi:tungstate transport system substrate-binding protein
MDRTTSRIGRRAFLGRLGAGGAAVGALLIACEASPSAAPQAGSTGASPTTAAAGPLAAAADPKVVRLSSVVIPQDSGLYTALLPEFEQRTGLKVEIATGQDVYGPARAGKADLVLSHYQHSGVLPFVQEGFAEFPRTVFSSPGALIGPAADPADVRNATDIVDAFTRIDRSGAKFIVNDQDGLRYVADVSRRAAGLTANERYVDGGTRGPDAMRAAAQGGAYTMWGLVPFLRLKQQQRQMPLEPLFTNDQLLKSLMVTVVVRAEKVPGVNTAGARSLEKYLAEAATQAKIRAFRMNGIDTPVWWPAAHDNEGTLVAAP